MNLKNTLANCTHAHKIYIFIYCCEIQYVNNIEKIIREFIEEKIIS